MTPPRLQARVRYTEPMVRRAVRVFVWRSVLRLAGLWAVAVLLLGFSAGLGLYYNQPYGVAFGCAGLLMPVVFVAAVWRAHFRNTVGRFRTLDPPEAEITVDDTGLSVRSSQGQATLPWSGFTAVWRLPDCWLLFLAPNHFMTLPLADLPAGMLDALLKHLPPPR